MSSAPHASGPAASAAPSPSDAVAPSPTPAAATPDVPKLTTGLWRNGAYVAVLCAGIALALTLFGRGSIWKNLVYSYAIGSLCWSIIDGLRVLIAGAHNRLQLARGEAPSHYGDFPNWPIAIAIVLFGMAVGSIGGSALGDLLTGKPVGSVLHPDSSWMPVTLVVTVLACVAAVFGLTLLGRLDGARAQAEAARRSAAELQLRLLQSQLEPHMLFNTLANLRALIDVDPARAQAMLDHMIAFLRATLGASRVHMHPLRAEFERLDDYLQLLAIRMGPRLRYRLDLPAALADLQMPPLLLQPLVENAIRHGLEPVIEGGQIEISARVDGDRLLLQVLDRGAGLPATLAPPGTGFGLEQVRERLRTVYGAQAGLSLEAAAGGGTLATVTMPLNGPAR
jgi:signal transduction histidine kinase